MSLIYNQFITAGLAAVAASAETSIVSVLGLQAGAGAPLGLFFDAQFAGTTGTGTTALVIRLRQGIGITGLILATLTFPIAASTGFVFAIQATDNTGYYQGANPTYSFTAQQTGGTGAGSSSSFAIGVFSLWLLSVLWECQR